MNIVKKILLGLCTLSLISCDKEQSVSFSEQFYQERLCPEIIYQCLPESQKNDIKETTMFDPNNPYQLSEAEWNDILQDAGTKGASLIKQKLEMVRSYMSTSWNVDIDELRTAVLRRAGQIEKLDLTTLK